MVEFCRVVSLLTEDTRMLIFDTAKETSAHSAHWQCQAQTRAVERARGGKQVFAKETAGKTENVLPVCARPVHPGSNIWTDRHNNETCSYRLLVSFFLDIAGPSSGQSCSSLKILPAVATPVQVDQDPSFHK
jgi:hypothetical protein